MDKTPLDRFLGARALDLSLWSWVQGAQWGTANAVTKRKLVSTFIEEFGLSWDLDSAIKVYQRMEDRYREVEKSDPNA